MAFSMASTASPQVLHCDASLQVLGGSQFSSVTVGDETGTATWLWSGWVLGFASRFPPEIAAFFMTLDQGSKHKKPFDAVIFSFFS